MGFQKFRKIHRKTPLPEFAFKQSCTSLTEHDLVTASVEMSYKVAL